MKKIIFCSLFFITAIASASAQTVSSCTDLSVNLMRRAESKNVLALQNFLYAKGILKVTPNGYFGPSTYVAVKQYQKSQGLSQVGIVGPGTRAAIKKESCSSVSASFSTPTPPAQVQSQSQFQSQPQPQQVSTSTGNQMMPGIMSVPTGLQPVISSFDAVSLFAGGTTNWNFSMHGTNFSTTSNTVIFRNVNTRKIYSIGTLPSATGTITLPINLTGTLYPCGMGCSEKLADGTYEVTVSTPGGISDPKIINVYPFVISAQTTAVNAVPAKVQSVRMGTLSFSTSQAIDVRTVNFSLGTSTISSGGLGNFLLKDEVTKTIFGPETALSPGQSALVGMYADTNNTTPGTVYGTFTVTIKDYIGGYDTTFTSNPIMLTIAGLI